MILYIDPMMAPIVGAKGFGGPTRLLCEEVRRMHSAGHDVHLTACAGSSPKDYFEGIGFHTLECNGKIQTEQQGNGRASVSSHNKNAAEEIAALIKKIKPDVIVSHAEPGISAALAKITKRPIAHVHHWWPSTNKFFDTGRLKQFLRMDELGVHVVFNSKPNLMEYTRLAEKYALSEQDHQMRSMYENALRWLKADRAVSSCHFPALEHEFVADREDFHVIASRCDEDKRIHRWVDIKRPIVAAFAPSRGAGNAYEQKVSSELERRQDFWQWKFGVPYTKVIRLMSTARSNLATGPTDSFGQTVFEAACLGTPSVLAKGTKGSAVEDLMVDLGVQMPVVTYSGADFVGRATAALDEAGGWSTKKRRRLYDLFQTQFSSGAFLKDRRRTMRAAIALRGE